MYVNIYQIHKNALNKCLWFKLRVKVMRNQLTINGKVHASAGNLSPRWGLEFEAAEDSGEHSPAQVARFLGKQDKIISGYKLVSL